MNVIIAIGNFILAVGHLVEYIKKNRTISLVLSVLCGIISGIYFAICFDEGDIVIQRGEDFDDSDTED